MKSKRNPVHSHILASVTLKLTLLIGQAEYPFAWQVSDDGEWAYRAPNQASDLSLSPGSDGETLHITIDAADTLYPSLWTPLSTVR